MNFLQLCQAVRREAGISGSGPTTTVSQTGELGKIVEWVLMAYQDIQIINPTWNFLRADFSFQTIAATSDYLPTAISLDELSQWNVDGIRSYLTSSGVAGERSLHPMSWEWLREVRLFGTISSGPPVELAIRPSKAIVLWPTPDAAYTITGEYWKRPQTMTANTDEPLIKDAFQMAIVWKAVKYYAADQGAAELYATASINYTHILNRLENDQLPEITFG